MVVEATIVAEFGTSISDSEFIVIELDDQANGDVTSFNPEHTPGFVVHYDPAKIRIDRVECSSGEIAGGNRVTRSRTKAMSFTNTEDNQQLSHIPSGDLTWNWRGKGTEVAAGARVNSPAIEQSIRDVRALGAVPAVGEVTFNMQCNAFTLTPPTLTLGEGDSWSILVVVYMEKV